MSTLHSSLYLVSLIMTHFHSREAESAFLRWFCCIVWFNAHCICVDGAGIVSACVILILLFYIGWDLSMRLEDAFEDVGCSFFVGKDTVELYTREYIC